MCTANLYAVVCALAAAPLQPPSRKILFYFILCCCFFLFLWLVRNPQSTRKAQFTTYLCELANRWACTRVCVGIRLRARMPRWNWKLSLRMSANGWLGMALSKGGAIRSTFFLKKSKRQNKDDKQRILRCRTGLTVILLMFFVVF